MKRSDLPPRSLAALEALDNRQARTSGASAIDWSLKDEIQAQSHVGVMQVPGLSLEILPKTDVAWDASRTFSTHAEEGRAQRNLLYMLSVADVLPFLERDLAHLAAKRSPLLEILIRRFVEGLLDELRRGTDRAYVTQSENCSVVKGRIVFREHLKRNLAHRERVFVEYDEFLSDTPLNRVLKLACAKLLRMTASNWSARCLSEALVHFADVRDVEPSPELLDSVRLHRNNQRFASAFEFARLVLERLAPAPQQGDARTFSLLFPMEKVFEVFVGRFIQKHATALGVARADVHLQAQGHRLPLLRSDFGSPHFHLEPDLLVGSKHAARLILDTKWKRLVSDQRDRKNGVSQSDAYQLFAYSERYRCPENILLFPLVAGATRKRFKVDGGDTGRTLRVEFLNVNRDLQHEHAAVCAELKEILRA